MIRYVMQPILIHCFIFFFWLHLTFVDARIHELKKKVGGGEGCMNINQAHLISLSTVL